MERICRIFQQVLLILIALVGALIYLLFRFAQDIYIKMAKKRSQKKRRKSKARSITHLPIKELPPIGQNHLKQERFAEAIKVFRRLMQEDEDAQWAELLCSSYQGRINQLMLKGMYKEAVVTFHALEKQFPEYASKLAGVHILLLIKIDQPDKAWQLYEQAEKELTKQEKQRIDETFAALFLSGNASLAEKFAPDSPLRGQLPSAQKALLCYTQGLDKEALEHLQTLPFRSPYKGFRMALNGMIAFHDQDNQESQDKARSFFEKVHADSPFFALITPYLQLVTDAEGNKPDRELDATEKKAVQLLQGMDNEKSKFLTLLKTKATTPGGFLHCLFKAGTCLDTQVAQQLSYRLLVHDPSYLRTYEKKFGAIKDEFVRAHFNALALEVKDASYQIPQEWQYACALLTRKTKRTKKKKPDDALKIALMHRHIANWIHRINGDEYHRDEQIEELQKSLEYDPDDKATWFRIHQLLSDRPADQYRWVNKMLKQFPKEPDIFFFGAEAAVGRSAFKKASRLAGDLLKIDPINTKVRELLIKAHINHGHKLAKQKKYALASKECEHASAFSRGGPDQGRIEITQGLIELIQGREKEAQSLLDKGEARYENKVLAWTQVRIDAERLQISPAWKKKFTTRLKAVTKHGPEKNELLQIIACLIDAHDNNHSAWKGVRTILLPYLKKGIDLALQKDEFVVLCQAFQRILEFGLLQAYGEKAVQQWPDTPLFTYYFFVGKSGAGRKRLNFRDIKELEDASNMAMRQKDSATVNLIDDFLEKHASFGFSGGPLGMLAGLFEQEMFDDNEDREERKPSKKAMERLFDIFGD
jgi:tetratricopeptide (TPR) repeat protein